jgi:YD repeat-containing protein
MYGLDGRLHRSEEPDGSSVLFRYDLEGDLRSVEHSGGERIRYEGAAGREHLRSETERCTTTIEFDAAGFPSRLIQRVDDFEWHIEYKRDEIGRVVACLYPQAHEWLQSAGSQDGHTFSTDVWAGSERYFRVSVGPERQQIAFADGTRTVLHASMEKGLEKATCCDSHDVEQVSTNLEMEQGRLIRSGFQSFEYDEGGRLTKCADPGQEARYTYDAAHRLAGISQGNQVTRLAYAEHPAPVRIDDETLTYDPLGRRVSRGDTRYGYNCFGQLTDVVLADGTSIHYVYDGFGRLVARECGSECTYYVVDFEGHRICEADAGGQVRRSYLWQGPNCIAEIEGVAGNTLTRSFHRGYSSRLQALGASNGELIPVQASDPYGADQIRGDGIPSFGSLFGDPATGLYHAGSRWFDPATAQFLTPDGWYGSDIWNHVSHDMRRVFDALPGGTNVEMSPETAYAWCRYDPINYSDPNGHSASGTFFGMFFSIISFFLWQMQVTTIALKLAALNFLIMILPSLFDLIYSGIKKQPLWGVNIFNAILPFLASSRLHVPWAFPLNSLYNAPGTVFTMGSVIWMRGSQHRGLEASSKRGILICANAADYLAADSVAGNTFAVARHNIKGTGTMDAAGQLITAPAIDPALAPITLAQAFKAGAALGVRKVAGGQEEFLVLNTFVGPDIQLDLPLPADFANQAVEFFRLDQPLVKIEKDGRTIARKVTFVRGRALHYQKQIPEDFPESGLKATEYLIKADPKETRFTPNNEFQLTEFTASDIGSYNTGDFVRILSGATYFGRKAERKQGTINLILDAAINPPGGATLDPKVEVAVMTASPEAPAANQAAAGDKVTVGAIRTLRKFDGLLITGGIGPDIDRRIVLQMFVRCTIDNLPAALHAKPLKVDLLLPEVTRGNGTVTAADTVTLGRDEAKLFKEKQPVRVTTGGGKEFAAVVKTVTAATEKLQFTENLPAADFPATTPITAVSLKAFKTLDCDPSAAPGGLLDIKSDDLASPVADELVFVRPASGADEPVLRKIKGAPAAPAVIAQIDSAPRNNANLTVQVFTQDKAKTHRGLAKKVTLRLTPVGPAHPFSANDEIHCTDNNEDYIGTNLAAPGGDVLLEDPISTPFGPLTAQHVESTGKTTNGANLAESLIAIPSDPEEDPVGRGRAVELHEMRHVWQYAVFGPFFFSQPIPWLVNLGFSLGNSKTRWPKLISTGGVERLFSVLAWGIRSRFKGPTAANATIGNTERTRIDFAAEVSVEDAAKFTEGAPIEVTANDFSVFNIIDKSVPSERQLDLKYPLEEEFPQGTAVKVTISPFEKINAQINDIFDLSKLWSFLPDTWIRTLKGFMNRDNWFPLLGVYPIAYAFAKFDQTRMFLEQDASFQSGDLYSPFGVSYPNEIFVGEFSRVLAFIEGRGAGDLATGLSHRGRAITRALTVEPKNIPGGKTARDLILGTSNVGGSAEVRFRKEFMIPINENVENVMGAMFLANTAGEYNVLSSGFSLDNMVDPAIWLPPFIPFFPTSFNDLRIIKVKELSVSKIFTNADPLFETESTTFVIKGAKDVSYTLDYKDPPPAVPGAINNLTFTAPRAAGPVTHNLAITSHYRADHEIFKGSGKLHAQITLPAASLSNVCQDLDVAVAPITLDAVAPVKVGKTAEFNASIAPTSIQLISAAIPEAAVQADLRSLGGRPAKLFFRAPNKVNAAQDVKFKLTFGTAPNDREIDVTIPVEP